MYSDNVRSEVTRYFEAFGSAIAVLLRPFAGSLARRWLGVAERQSSIILAFDDDQYAAVLAGRWLGADVVTAEESVQDVLGGRYRDIRGGPFEDVFSVAVKRVAGPGLCTMALTHDYRVALTLNSPETSLGFVGPTLYPSVPDDLLNVLQLRLPDAERARRGLRIARPPWVFALLSNLPDERALEGLDEDPIIAAHGVADAILSLAGERLGAPGERYAIALEELQRAIATLSENNERAIHSVVAKQPWVLVDEVDYTDVGSEVVLEYTEALGEGVYQARRIIPDFLYDQYDDQSLVVEIESYPKRLFVTRTEAGFEVPSAEARDAAFQILGYRRIIDGPAGREIRQTLNKPDAWAFRYLLVIGSETQGDFDRRAWNNLREIMGDAGVQLRTWDFYMSRLERLRHAADFAGA